MSLTKNSKHLLKERYCRKDETPYQVFDRVAESLSIGDTKFKAHLAHAMKNSYFLPASPTLRNAGIKKSLLHPCHILPVHDSIESIMECLGNTATIFHYGGGVGFNISKLRPIGAPLSAGGVSSGAISFLSLFDQLTEVVKQGGFRRGALMCVMDYNHPEIMKFISAKLTGKLTNFNISVLVDDDFMSKVNTEEYIELKFNDVVYDRVKARNIFEQIVFCAHTSGDPGLLFYDRINKDNPLFPKVKIISTNPCVTGETPVLTSKGYFPIEELVGKKVRIWNGLEWSSVTPFSTGKNEIVRVHLSNGVSLDCTPYHKFVVENKSRTEGKEFVAADQLEEGHILPKFDLPVVEGGSNYESNAYSQGFYSGDGNTGLEKSRVYSKKFCCIPRLKGNVGKLCNGNGEKDIRNWYHGKMNAKDFVPINDSVEYKLDWLAGICDSDGCVASNSIQISSIDKKFLLNVRLMLTTLGEETTVSLMKKKCIKEIKGKEYSCKDCYRLVIAHSQVMNLVGLGLNCCRLKLPHTDCQRAAKRFIRVVKVEALNKAEDTYCFTELLEHKGVFNGLLTGQCGEVPLPEWCSCNLGAVNLSKLVSKSGNFNFKKYRQILELGIRTLKNINAVGWYPFPQMTKMMKTLDPCGLGVFGFADALIKLGIIYGSQESLDFIDEIAKDYVSITNEIAKGSFYKRSQQPTGSLSIIADCSPGIEPVFERKFERHLTIGVIEEVRELYQSKYCKTAMEISPEEHLAVQAKFQSYIDAGVSKTVNLPYTASVETVKNIYYDAWAKDCKGITVFRQGCKEGVFVVSKCSDGECYL